MAQCKATGGSSAMPMVWVPRHISIEFNTVVWLCAQFPWCTAILLQLGLCTATPFVQSNAVQCTFSLLHISTVSQVDCSANYSSSAVCSFCGAYQPACNADSHHWEHSLSASHPFYSLSSRIMSVSDTMMIRLFYCFFVLENGKNESLVEPPQRFLTQQIKKRHSNQEFNIWLILWQSILY